MLTESSGQIISLNQEDWAQGLHLIAPTESLDECAKSTLFCAPSYTIASNILIAVRYLCPQFYFHGPNLVDVYLPFCAVDAERNI